MRHEEEAVDIEQDEDRLAVFLLEYQTLATSLHAFLLKEGMQELYGDLAKLIGRIADYVLWKNDKTRKRKVFLSAGARNRLCVWIQSSLYECISCLCMSA